MVEVVRPCGRCGAEMSGGAIGTQRTPDAGVPSPGVTSAVTSCPSAASPSATAVTCTDPPFVPGTV